MSDRINIGRFKITSLEFGKFKLDGGAMFGVVPKVLWERVHPADEKNRIDMALRCMLIEVEDRKILVDTGFGEGRVEKFRKIYDYRGSENYLDDVLGEQDLSRDQITDVIITHLHFDHVGGATQGKDATPHPAFPNAKYYMQYRQVEHARSRFERDKASYFPHDFEPLLEAGVVKIFDGAWELVPGLSMFTVDGHTPSQQLIKIEDGGETLIYAADLIPLACHFSLPWIMAYDLNPVKTLNEKRELLTEAAEKGWTFFFEHDLSTVMAKVQVGEKGFEVVQI